MRLETDLLLDILESIEAVEKYTSHGRMIFDSDELIQVWVVHHLQIIGEACRMMPKEIQDGEPNIPWKGIIGMRNILVHQYHSIDPDIIWEMIIRDIPTFKKSIQRMLIEYTS